MKIDTSPVIVAADTASMVVWMGATLREPRGEEISAYGVSFDTKGVAIEQIDDKSPLGGTEGLQKGDLLMNINGKRVHSIEDIRKAYDSVLDGKLQLRVVRSQKETTLTFTVKGLSKP